MSHNFFRNTVVNSSVLHDIHVVERLEQNHQYTHKNVSHFLVNDVDCLWNILHTH